MSIFFYNKTDKSSEISTVQMQKSFIWSVNLTSAKGFLSNQKNTCFGCWWKMPNTYKYFIPCLCYGHAEVHTTDRNTDQKEYNNVQERL